MIPSTLDALTVDISTLRPYAANPRNGDIDAIAESLRVNGQYRPIVVRQGGEILAGNHTYMAAMQLGWERIAATFVDCDDEQAARIVLVDNRANDLAGYSDGDLIALLESLPSLDGTGYDQEALDALLGKVQQLSPGEDTEPGEPPADPRTNLGDVYLMGDHWLMCGDSTDALAVGQLMEGARADCMWTDPPYGVSYVGKTKDALTIANDGADTLDQLLADAFALAVTALKPGAAVYCAHPAGERSVVFHARFAEAFSLRQGLVWSKGQIVLGHSDYHYSHEPILYGYTAGEGRRGRGGAGWYGDDSQRSVIEIPKPAASREHPTSKPVDLIEHCLGNSTAPGHVLYEPFGGSGSTLIACENLGRRCYTMELDPGYCDVIVDRWERHTGKRAELVDRGQA